MSAYVIVDVEVKDPERYEEYKKLSSEAAAAYDGRFVVRGGRAEALEGDREPRRIVVLEFQTYERAKAWWDSPEYAAAKKLRQEIADTSLIVVEGA